MNPLAIGSIVILFVIVASINTIPLVSAKIPPVDVQIPIVGVDDRCAKTNECYIPYEVTVEIGGQVIWTNDDDVFHTVTAGDLRSDSNMIGEKYPNGFSSGVIAAGENFKYKFTKPGTYPYLCTIHPWMIGAVTVDDKESINQITQDPDNNGCLIATATYGSELSNEVQMLRELRDDSLLETKSGSAFMSAFNQVYYAFSPTIADWERESPIFKETIKIAITPLLSTLSILNYVDMNSEESVLGYGIGVITLNLAMYIGIPVIGTLKLYQLRKN